MTTWCADCGGELTAFDRMHSGEKSPRFCVACKESRKRCDKCGGYNARWRVSKTCGSILDSAR